MKDGDEAIGVYTITRGVEQVGPPDWIVLNPSGRCIGEYPTRRDARRAALRRIRQDERISMEQ